MRSPIPNQPWRGGIDFPLWGAKVEIARLAPSSLLLADAPTDNPNAAPTTTHSLQALHRIQPEQWRQLLDPWLVVFMLKDAQGAVVAGHASRRQLQRALVGPLQHSPRCRRSRGDYTVHLEVQAVSRDSIGGPGTGIPADPKPIRASGVNLVMDANNDTLVDAGGRGSRCAGNPAPPSSSGRATGCASKRPSRLTRTRSSSSRSTPPFASRWTSRCRGTSALYVRLEGAGGALFLAPHAGMGTGRAAGRNRTCATSRRRAVRKLCASTRERRSPATASSAPRASWRAAPTTTSSAAHRTGRWARRSRARAFSSWCATSTG